jgi:hypothetical protein
MASTYENDLRLEEMATGENSGSWGTKTNTNLELIADAFSYGTEIIADADTAITIADGAADAARSLALKINSSEDLTTTRVVTLVQTPPARFGLLKIIQAVARHLRSAQALGLILLLQMAQLRSLPQMVLVLDLMLLTILRKTSLNC